MRELRVLIVDDDASTRLGLSELLRTAGYGTYEASTFHEAVEALRDYAPDLLITDIRLGSFNGLHLLIRAPNDLPVIITTGFGDPILEREARRHGAEYVLKPLSPPAFLQLVRRFLDPHRGQGRIDSDSDDQVGPARFSLLP